MLIETIERPIFTGGLITVHKATIKASAKVFNFFSDNTYTQNYIAVVRELVANGMDAHDAAGTPDVPVQVWLPNELNPVFRVKDSGTGMSHDFVTGPYTILGDGSTKDQDDLARGGWGIGRFSAFAIVDQYALRCVHDGILTIYSVFKDEEGIPTIGTLGQTETDEPNSVEVSFPVKTEDFGEFANAANAALKFFNPVPTLHGGDIDLPDYIMRGTNWAINRKAGPLGVIMGGIRYPVDIYKVSYELRHHDRVSALLEYGLDLTLPIGTCGVALSRESLAYNQRTFDALTNALEAVINNITAGFSTMFDVYDTEWEAKQALCVEVPVGNRYSARAKLMLSNAKYRGEPLTTEVDLQGQSWHIAVQRTGRRVKTKIGSAKWDFHDQKLRLDDFETVIIDDLPPSPKFAAIKRIKTYVEDRSRIKSTIVLRDPKFSINVPRDMFVYTSDMPAPEKAVYVKFDRPKARMFRLDYLADSFNPGRWGHGAASEIDYANQPATGILVIGDNFSVPIEVRRKLDTGLVGWSECHFVNIGDGEKLKKTWRMFDDVFAERIQAAIDEDPLLPQRIAIYSDPHCSEIMEKLCYLTIDDFSVSKRKTPAARLVELRTEYSRKFNRALIPFIPGKLPAGVDMKKLRYRFDTQQTLAAHYLASLSVLKHNHLEFKIFMELI